MDEGNVLIECRDCTFRDSFANLGRARVALADHESETGHGVDWQINRVADGVERAGDDAGICGVSGCTNTESALLDWPQSDDES
ncbi:hypothetical protein SAMN04487948_10775 [Halogranum amylolyticum]|uniref:Uncharacterized protein n=1 Tax=Halogranum amylolyticum TaxID=660520 RepID=A0A1H8TJ99_9EURY|nr:hypothetical protein [Halogranum amylolyticum]SEO90624.1 hypothetical protein SAMN04487948_10775 [Halogranum amylolyticum]